MSKDLSLLNQQGSGVKFGDLLIVPIEDSFLYVQPIFVISSGQIPIPELKRVVVVHGGNVSLANSLTDALALSFGQPTGGGGGWGKGDFNAGPGTTGLCWALAKPSPGRVVGQEDGEHEL